MLNTIITFGVVALFILLGLLIFGAVAWTLVHQGERESRYNELESRYSSTQMARTTAKIDKLNAIRSLPYKGGVIYSSLWEEYHALDAEDDRLTRQERRELVDASALSLDAEEMLYGTRNEVH